MKTKSNMTVSKLQSEAVNLFRTKFVREDNYQTGVNRIDGFVVPEDIEQFLSDQIQKAYNEGYEKGISDEIECVETSGEHLDLQNKMKRKLIKFGKSTFNLQQMFSECQRHKEIIVDFMGYKFKILSIQSKEK